MRVLLTRTVEQAGETGTRLDDLGHEAEVLPLVKISHLPVPLPKSDFDAIAFTSAHAPRLLAQTVRDGDTRADLFNLPVWCVGAATAQACREAGFGDVRGQSGDARELAQLLQSTLKPGSRLLYPGAKHLAFDLVAALNPVMVERVIVYEATLLEPSSRALESALRRCRGGALLLYSERTALHLVDLVNRYGLDGMLIHLTPIAISEKTAEAVRRACDIRVMVADRPDEGSMLAKLAHL